MISHVFILSNILFSSAGLELGLCLRDICAANRSDEKQQIKALLESVDNSFCPDNVDWFGRDGGDVLMSTLGMLIDLFSENFYMLILLIAQRQNYRFDYNHLEICSV
ncbi:hypothetical protein Dimus_016018 [Dionaea muscipula]